MPRARRGEVGDVANAIFDGRRRHAIAWRDERWEFPVVTVHTMTHVADDRAAPRALHGDGKEPALKLKTMQTPAASRGDVGDRQSSRESSSSSGAKAARRPASSARCAFRSRSSPCRATTAPLRRMAHVRRGAAGNVPTGRYHQMVADTDQVLLSRSSPASATASSSSPARDGNALERSTVFLHTIGGQFDEPAHEEPVVGIKLPVDSGV